MTILREKGFMWGQPPRLSVERKLDRLLLML